MASPARKPEPSPDRTPNRRARAELTPDQRAAREEVLELMLRHNPEPTEEELEAIEREWLEA